MSHAQRSAIAAQVIDEEQTMIRMMHAAYKHRRGGHPIDFAAIFPQELPDVPFDTLMDLTERLHDLGLLNWKWNQQGGLGAGLMTEAGICFVRDTVVEQPSEKPAQSNSQSKPTRLAEATVDDFAARVDWHLQNATQKLQGEWNQIRGKFAASGGLHSGMVRMVLEANQKEFEGATNTVLNELRRAIELTTLDPQVLRVTVEQKLRQFVATTMANSRIANEAGRLGMHNQIKDKSQEMERHLQFALRQFDVGFHLSEESAAMTNNGIIAKTIIGGVQQNSPGATQTVEIDINIENVRHALNAFESELSKANLDGTTKDELAAEIETIKAQLKKPSPSKTILREAAKSIRSVVEGIAAGLITNEFVAAATALGIAILPHV